MRLAGAKPVLRYADGPAAGGPAVTRHELGAGQAWYVSARTDAATTARLLAAVSGSAGLATRNQPDLEIVRRSDGTRRFITLINHGAADADTEVGGRLVNVPAGEVVVIREEAAAPPGRSSANAAGTSVLPLAAGGSRPDGSPGGCRVTLRHGA